MKYTASQVEDALYLIEHTDLVKLLYAVNNKNGIEPALANRCLDEYFKAHELLADAKKDIPKAKKAFLFRTLSLECRSQG